jgi:hypothetical protein
MRDADRGVSLRLCAGGDDDGVTGLIVESENQAVEAVKEVARLDRGKVRARFEERFTASRMAREYEAHYGQLVASRLARAVSRTSRPDPSFIMRA